MICNRTHSTRWGVVVAFCALFCGLPALASSPPDTVDSAAEEREVPKALTADELASRTAAVQALLIGAAPEDVAPQEVIGHSLISLREIRHAAADLKQEHEQLGALAEQLKAAAEALAEAPPPPPAAPEAFTQTPPARPSAPVNPEAPTEDEVAALAAFEAAQSAYDQAAAEHAVAVKAHAAAVLQHEADMQQRRQAVETEQAKLARRLELLNTQRNLVAKRQAYVERLLQLVEELSGPAQHGFDAMGARREAFWNQLDTLRGVGESVDLLAGRVRQLARLLGTGRVVGFSVDLAELQSAAGRSQRDLERRSLAMTRHCDVLKELLRQQEQSATQLKGGILRTVGAPNRMALADEAFLAQLRRQRQLRREVSGIKVGLPQPERVARTLRGLLAQPSGVLSTADAKHALEEVQRTERLLARFELELEALVPQWRLAFTREQVTLLSELASPETRAVSLQLSSELLEDLSVELRGIQREAARWGADRSDLVRGLAATDASSDTWLKALEWLGAMGLVLLAIGIRRRVPLWLGGLVAWVARRAWARTRVGSVVRWGTLLKEVAPTLLVLAAFYVAVLIVGPEHPELTALGTVIWWFGWYYVGKHTLVGLIRSAAPNQPALVALSPTIAALAERTYARFGFFFTWAIVIDELSRRLMGVGRLQTLIDYTMVAWVLGWSIWAMVAWRTPLAERLIGAPGFSEGFGRTTAEWMNAHALGFVLSPVAGLWLVAKRLAWLGRQVLAKGGVLAYLQTKALLRRSNQAQTVGLVETRTLPEDYVREFPLYPVLGEDGPLLLHRPEPLAIAQEQLGTWERNKTGGSLVVLGDKGVGKTTFLSMWQRQLHGHDLVNHTWQEKTTSEAAVVAELGRAVGGPTKSREALCAFLLQGPERVLLLDEMHNVFLRTVDGFRGFDALVNIVNATHEKVFWVLVFNSYAWRFINESRRRTRYFRRLMGLARWTFEDLQNLIARRNARINYTIRFDQALIDSVDQGQRQYHLMESSDSYFRLLHDLSEGNPRIATHYWLSSLRPLGPKTLEVSLFRRPRFATDGLTDDMLFVMAAVVQHENLSAEDLEATLRLKPDVARFSLQFLREREIIEPKEKRPHKFCLSPKHQQSVIDLLHNKHLLFGPEA